MWCGLPYPSRGEGGRGPPPRAPRKLLPPPQPPIPGPGYGGVGGRKFGRCISGTEDLPRRSSHRNSSDRPPEMNWYGSIYVAFRPLANYETLVPAAQRFRPHKASAGRRLKSEDGGVPEGRKDLRQGETKPSAPARTRPPAASSTRRRKRKTEPFVPLYRLCEQRGVGTAVGWERGVSGGSEGVDHWALRLQEGRARSRCGARAGLVGSGQKS